jgi:predicted Ser/Thr protein kinase
VTTRQPLLNSRFRLLHKLGDGGMGSVWLAEDTWLERPVALKELARTPDGALDLGERRQRVLQEARALARVRHPAIVPVHDLFFTGDDPWIVMEYINGRALDKIIHERTLDERSIARIGLHVLGGLAAVHRAGIVHRDVKPANIVMADDDSVFLVDFGIAKIAGDPSLTGQRIVGTVEYLAPERLKAGAKVGPPADIWALGVTFCYALEGHTPFRRHSEQDWQAVLLAIAQDTPKLTKTGPLADITARMLVKDPAQRATAKEITAVLDRIVRAVPAAETLSLRPSERFSGSFSERTRPATATLSARPAARSQDWQTAMHDGLRDELQRVGPDTGAAMLLAMDARSVAKLLADCPHKRRGELLQAIAAVDPTAAAVILPMLLDTKAGLAFAYLQPQTAASLLSAMRTPEAARILASTEARAAASTIMELPPGEAAVLLKALSDTKRAAEVLTHATAPTTIAVVRTDPAFGRAVLLYLTDPLRAQVSRALASAS